MTNKRNESPGNGRYPPAAPPSLKEDMPTEVWYPPGNTKGSAGFFSTVAKLFLFISILFFACTIVGAFSFAAVFYFSDTIFPGLHVGETPIGGLTRDEATAVLAEWEADYFVDLVHEENRWPVNAAELGLTLDAADTVRSALHEGRTVNSFLWILGGGTQVEPVWSFDPLPAQAALERIAPEIRIEPRDARIVVDQGVAREAPAVEGQALDIERTMAYLQADPNFVLQDGRLPLAMQPLLPARSDVSGFLNEAQQLLARQVTISAFDPLVNSREQILITPDRWQGWLSLVVDPDQEPPFDWVVQEEAAQNFLAAGLTELGPQRYLQADALLPSLVAALQEGQPTVSTRIYHYPQQHIVQAGESFSSIGHDYGIPYPWIQQANPGSEFLAAGDTITIPSPDALLPLPVVEDKRVIVSIGQQRVYVYENNQLLWDWAASTGIDTSPTAPGIFQVQSHSLNAYAENWDLWMPHFMGIYRPVPEFSFMNGFHGFPTRNGSNLLWTGNLGTKVTYGCILISSDNAATLYDWAEEGVVVEIKP